MDSVSTLVSQGWYSLTPLGSTLWVVAVALEFVAFLMGGINFITTTMNSRAPGMKLWDIPMVVWMIVIASILFMASVGPLVQALSCLFSTNSWAQAFLTRTAVVIPSCGSTCSGSLGTQRYTLYYCRRWASSPRVITTFARKKLFAYKIVLYTAIATGILSFFVWAHHQFISGIDPRMANIFTVTTVLISVPLAEMMFVYIATLYGGSIRLETPMLWALGFLGTFLIGGVTGIFLGASGSDIYMHDTYFVLAHFHYTFYPIAIIGVFAVLTYWYPKMFGRHMNEFWGKVHFWITIIAFNGIFLPLFVLGMAGQHRRIYDFSNYPNLSEPWMWDMRQFATISLVVMLLAQPIFLINFFGSMFKEEGGA